MPAFQQKPSSHSKSEKAQYTSQWKSDMAGTLTLGQEFLIAIINMI